MKDSRQRNLCPVCASGRFTTITIRFDSSRIVRCSECGHIYINPIPMDKEQRSLYKDYHSALDTPDEERYMKRIDGWFNEPKGPYQFTLRIIEGESGFSGKYVLDVGCGPGRFLYECHKRGALVTGVDFNLQAARLAKKYFNLDIISKSFEQAVDEGDLGQSSFDIIFAFEVIEHMQKPIEFLNALYQLLVPGGLLFISTPNFYLYYSMGKSAAVVRQCPEHINFFEPPSLERYLKQCHLDVVDITTVGQLTYSDRKKGVYMDTTIIRKLWQKLRDIRLVYFIKNIFFRVLDKHTEIIDTKSWNGVTLVCVARKPMH
ncbi:MAG: class I SAM-dependent methyltransferase [Candidatus Omnitrophota bacterium]|nr:MAG: class I SAM-dependent methyltransferase [Candidatus Omnitrophota bacterium]